ncbi:esterase-like activity of phytase family protein [Paracoccus aerodenitrificans]|uniref:esterase-like activity of phytase family protein n=1 Tax=Paracoccus aerodenitrificans TaxID=3017781 RepID=UPI0022F10224|nr:esterase-like activity of phytase family protein [Paracoccus aerodenitrificans]WBU63423.1 esterase-like activity of phytase family protein [Paracoccus aerodenitrificans]
MLLRNMLASGLAIIAATPALAEPTFNRIASFATANNMAEGEDRARETSAEIMAVTEDGNRLIYSDSPLGVIGMIDITDARMPKPLGNIDMEGEPTTTVVRGDKAFVGVNTSESFTEPSGVLRTVDLSSNEVTASCDLGGQPDSVAISPAGDMIAVAIENERDEEVNDAALPQMPAGFVVRLPVNDEGVDCAALERIELTGLADVAPEDPEPEFLDFNEAGEIAVTLQENNHIVVIGADGAIASDFSAGAVSIDGVDIAEEGALDFTGSLTDIPREPDALKWLDNDHFVVANEGDWNGGSRGFTIFNKDGSVVFDSGNSLDRALAEIGHYPEGRSENKGGEPEAVTVGTYGDQRLIFVASERGSIVAVYDATDPAAPELLQMLPSGIGPEGLVPIPARNLFATANETDLGEDGAARAHVMIFERAEGEADYPLLTSAGSDPLIGWGALSGLALNPSEPTTLYAISDSAYETQPSIFTIDASSMPAKITAKTVVTRDGAPAEKLDLEGIATVGEGGFWLASEGHPDNEIPHAVLHVGADGAITEEFTLPEALLEGQARFGLEGIAVQDGKIWVAVQREWADDPAGQVKLLQLDPASGEWTGVRYPLDSGEGWVGLSELAINGDYLYLIERDNLIGDRAALKAVTRVALADLAPAALDGDLPLVEKETVRDLIPDMQKWNGYVQDKVEGMAIAEDGTVWIVTDNDGVDDASGETLMWSFKLN